MKKSFFHAGVVPRARDVGKHLSRAIAIMEQSVDLRELLESWPYNAEDNVRVVRGSDGREVLQVRLPLGIEQYELEGRPDGQRPRGRESIFDFHLERLSRAEAAGKADSFTLNQEECAELFNEATLYYFRYLNLFQLKDWERTLRDTSRNLRVFDLVRRHAEREDDQVYLEQWRPYVLRIHAVSSAMLALARNHHTQALQHIETAIETIEGLPELEDETFQFERRRSLGALREIASQIEKNRPVSELEMLERQLQQAIEAQAFERAATLRDRIRALRKSQS